MADLFDPFLSFNASIAARIICAQQNHTQPHTPSTKRKAHGEVEAGKHITGTNPAPSKHENNLFFFTNNQAKNQDQKKGKTKTQEQKGRVTYLRVGRQRGRIRGFLGGHGGAAARGSEARCGGGKFFSLGGGYMKRGRIWIRIR
jgi:hypothetical protein